MQIFARTLNIYILLYLMGFFKWILQRLHITIPILPCALILSVVLLVAICIGQNSSLPK